jgi:acyl dehydratase
MFDEMIIDCKEAFGGYFDDFSVGQIYKHWPNKTITEAENHLFCLLTMNHHPVHLDNEFVKQHQHGKILVVGTYVLSLVVGMTVSKISGKAIANLEYEKITHDHPVFIGDTINAETEILELLSSSSKPDRGIIYVETRAFNQSGIKVLSLRRRILIPKRTF